MNKLKKKYYRIIESVAKKIIRFKDNSKNENFKTAIRSAIYYTSMATNKLIFSTINGINYVLFASDWIPKKLFIDGEFNDKILFKATKILKIKKSKCTLINIGAHIGSTCIPAVKKKYFKKLIAFEPAKKNFRLLTANIFLNNIEDISNLYNLALSNKKNHLRIKQYTHTGDYRVVSQKNKNSEIVKCDILDNYTSGLNKKNSLIFMDAQGHEPNIFLGSKKTIRKKIPIVVEFDPFLLNKNWKKGFSLLFKNYKFFYNLHEPLKKKKFTQKEIIYLFNNLKSKKEKYTDLLIV